jgi:anti-sigma factor RsiW
MTHQDAIRTMASERYLLDEMDEQERERFEEHFFDCVECAADLRMANAIREEAGALAPSSASPRRAATVLRPNRASWRRPLVALPWAAAASLAITVGYQSLVTVPALEELGRPRALNPVMLRGATRAAAGEVAVPIADEQKLVALVLDVDSGPTAQLSYSLLGPGGDTLVSGRVSAPAAGAPLMLLLPTEKLARTGRHVLIVHDVDRPQTVIGEYPFVTSH